MMPAAPTFSMEAIGCYHSSASCKSAAPRQGVFASGCGGIVELLPGRNYEQALRDLEGFDRIWLLFVFHQNLGHAWRPTTRPPVETPGHARVGTFASRAPYRPNPIGMSCVKCVGISGLCLRVEEADLLDGTPVLDIKPYLRKADCFPQARCGWVEAQNAAEYAVRFSAESEAQLELIFRAGGPDLRPIVRTQLSCNPLDATRRRVAPSLQNSGEYELSIRMWRAVFTIKETTREITVRTIRSGYTPEELMQEDDRYQDKAQHREFLRYF